MLKRYRYTIVAIILKMNYRYKSITRMINRWYATRYLKIDEVHYLLEIIYKLLYTGTHNKDKQSLVLLKGVQHLEIVECSFLHIFSSTCNVDEKLKAF